jgi:hypothetical protein
LPLVNAINRAPNDEAATEAIYEVRLTTSAEHLDESREAARQLEFAHYQCAGLGSSADDSPVAGQTAESRARRLLLAIKIKSAEIEAR